MMILSLPGYVEAVRPEIHDELGPKRTRMDRIISAMDRDPRVGRNGSFIDCMGCSRRVAAGSGPKSLAVWLLILLELSLDLYDTVGSMMY